jgi:hypothetical protein
VSFSEPLGTFDVLVGAHAGELLGYRATLFEALGNAYPTNPEVSELGEVELLGLVPGSDTLNGGNAIARTCDNFDGNECLAKSQIATADDDGNFLFSPNPTSSDDPLAEVQMYYHLDLVARWFEDTQGFTHPFPTEGLVNFDYNNAVFGDVDGDGLGEVAFGQTSSIDFAYDGMSSTTSSVTPCSAELRGRQVSLEPMSTEWSGPRVDSTKAPQTSSRWCLLKTQSSVSTQALAASEVAPSEILKKIDTARLTSTVRSIEMERSSARLVGT